MRILRISLTLIAAAVWSGCATIFTGTSDDIRFESEPPGATVYIEGIPRGETPVTVEVGRDGLGETVVRYELDGYETRMFTLQDEFNAVSILNLTNLVGWGVDIISGAVTKYEPHSYRMEMEPEGQAYLLEELQRDENGNFIIPVQEGKVVVNDPRTGLYLVFEK